MLLNQIMSGIDRDLFNAISKQSILSDSIPKYDEIKNYCIITVNDKEYITEQTVDNILTYQGEFTLVKF